MYNCHALNQSNTAHLIKVSRNKYIMGYDNSELYAKWEKERKAKQKGWRLADLIDRKALMVLSILAAVPVVMYFIR